MDFAPLISTVISVFAFGAATALLLRYRTWRFGFFAAMTTFATALIMVYAASGVVAPFLSMPVPRVGGGSAITVLLISVMAMIAVFFLERIINDRMRAEQALRLPMLSVQRSSISAFWIGPDGRILDTNESAHGSLGYSREDLLAKSVNDIDPELGPEVWAGYWERLKQRGSITYESSHRTKDGGLVPVEVTANWLTFSGDEYVCAFASDIRERKRAENELKVAWRHAEIANRAKSEFLANMSHELRTPLNAIIGFAEIMDRELFGSAGSDRNREYVRDILNSGTHLLTLISDILDLSKIEAGKLVLDEDTVDVFETVASCIRIIKGRAHEGEVRLVNMVTKDLPPIRSDARALKQIVLNLLSNSVKFTLKGGEVTIAATCLEDGSFDISVRDNGIGIAEQDIPKVLQPFHQVELSLTRGREGTGLGLALVRSLLDLHGATLHIESEIGVGTTVTVRFPAERVLHEAFPPTETSRVAGAAD